jgi:hypothetical protein
MSRLFPSEVARLVLGYLKEKGCHRAHDEFLRESPDLNEFRSCMTGPNTYDYPTAVNNRTLVQHLNNTGAIVQNTTPQPQPVFVSQPAPIMAQTLPLITHTLPFITATPAPPAPTPVPVPAIATISQRDIEMLKRLQANQISALTSKMNLMVGKTNNRSSNDKRVSTSKSQQQPQNKKAVVQSNTKQQSAAPSVTKSLPVIQPAPAPQVIDPPVTVNEAVDESPVPADPFKTPVKQIVRRTRHGYVTPNGTVRVSPKKATPRKSLTPRKLTPGKSSDASSAASCSSDRDSTLTPSKINLNNIHVEPEKLVEKFISMPSMPDLLAEKINEIWKNYNCDPGVETLVSGDICVLDSAVQTPTKSTRKSAEKADQAGGSGGGDHAPVDQMVNNVLKELEQHTSINQFIDEFAANECMGISGFSDLDCLLPFGSESSPFSSYDSTPVHSVGDQEDHNPGSLTTPKSDFREQPIASSSSHTAAASHAVKNLMQDLKTPEKKVPSPFNSSPFTMRKERTGRSSSPVCIVIPDECGASQLEQPDPVLHSDAAESPAKKFRKLAPANSSTDSKSQGKHVPVPDMQTMRISGGSNVRMRGTASASQLREAQRKLMSVPGKRR